MLQHLQFGKGFLILLCRLYQKVKWLGVSRDSLQVRFIKVTDLLNLVLVLCDNTLL